MSDRGDQTMEAKARDNGDQSSNGSVGLVQRASHPQEDISSQDDPQNSSKCTLEEDDELEEGELKDDDDDDDDDDGGVANDVGRKTGDAVDGLAKASRLNTDESDAENRNRCSSSDSRKSSNKEGSQSTARGSLEGAGNEARRKNLTASSIRSSSSSIDRIHKPINLTSRHESTSRHSSRSHSRSKRRLSPITDQARLVSMRAQLLEAKSREIEMKFQKNKIHVARSSLLSTITTTPLTRNLKTTITKPPITYAENPNPSELPDEPKKRSRGSRSSKQDSKERSRSSKKTAKRKKRKSLSSSKRKKRAKINDSRKIDAAEKTSTVNTNLLEDAVDRVGPKTPPDNQVLTLDDEQVEWPSYLIKMTTTQPSISYSVNPDSVAENNITSRPETSDLNADYQWYYNYFVDTFDMDKIQAQNQAYSILISTANYEKDLVDRWLERQGFSKDSESENNLEASRGRDTGIDEAPIPLRSTQPSITTLKSQREIVLPNGKVLPRGTVQKIVHQSLKTERVVPELIYSNFDMY